MDLLSRIATCPTLLRHCRRLLVTFLISLQEANKMSELTNFANSLKRGEILLPLLKQFLEKQKRREDKGLISKKAWVIEDAQMTIDCFKKRIEEYNHGEEIVGEYFHPSQLGQ